MERKSVSIMFGVCLLMAAQLCHELYAQGTEAQGSKPEPVPMKLRVGDVAPDFKLNYFDGGDLKEVSLSQYHGKSNVVVAFYIFAFTGG
jgi:hypothetical protein